MLNFAGKTFLFNETPTPIFRAEAFHAPGKFQNRLKWQDLNYTCVLIARKT